MRGGCVRALFKCFRGDRKRALMKCFRGDRKRALMRCFRGGGSADKRMGKVIGKKFIILKTGELTNNIF